MVSLQANTNYLDYRFTYDITDLRKPNEEPKGDPTTIFGFLQNNPEFSIFYNLVVQAKLDGKLNSLQANFTMLIPNDKTLLEKYDKSVFTNMDLFTSREIILYSTLNRKITYEMLLSSKAMYLDTMIDKSLNAKILSEWCPDNRIVLNNSANIVTANIIRSNGIIHETSDILVSPTLGKNGRFALRRYFACG